MRATLVFLFLTGSAFYGGAAWYSYLEDQTARDRATLAPSEDAFRHPETNLRILREALDRGDYTDRLVPHLERSFDEAPSFYQPPLLMAAFYANRLERPDLVQRSFEAALGRFPSNGRLHLTYAQWLLTPRPNAPYRAFRDPTGPESRKLALERLGSATSLEPELTRQALGLMLRFQVPVAEWAHRLPRTERTQSIILDTLDRSAEDREVRSRSLSDFLAGASTLELARNVAHYGEKWGEPELAREAASRWRELAIQAADAREIVRSTGTEARHLLARGESNRAYRLLRETLTVLEERSLSRESALELLCLLADEYRNRRQHAMAQGLYSEAAAISPHYAPAYLGLARNYRALGDVRSARLELDRILEFDPGNEEAQRELSQILAREGR
jgi:Tfp pilus assembly protein PilF